MKWFLLPGMGATDAMYNGLKHKLGFKVNFLNWPEYRGEKTYADVARRVIKEIDIGADGRPQNALEVHDHFLAPKGSFPGSRSSGA